MGSCLEHREVSGPLFTSSGGLEAGGTGSPNRRPGALGPVSLQVSSSPHPILQWALVRQTKYQGEPSLWSQMVLVQISGLGDLRRITQSFCVSVFQSVK